jgi:3-phenylpropionate/trans-cinnamate dioxygenase ferredoxin reductase subunit
VIGGSYIGTELAASFTKIGKHCELIMLEAVTHERVYGPEVGRYFHDLLVEHGVRIHGSQELERFEGSERVERVVTKSGLAVDCDVVVIGAGVHPDIHLAEQAGIETDQGVLTDRYLETSVPGIFAAGDIAEYDSVVHRRRIRIEHWDVAFNQGKYAALNMLGQQKVYDVVPYFWSDLADWGGMEYVGPASEWDEVWFRGTVAEGRFTAWYIEDGKVAAALTVGRSDDLTVAAQLLAAGIDVRAHRALIEDPSAHLSALLDQGG